MALLPRREWRMATAIAEIGYCNPFLKERVEVERRALGDAFVEVGAVIWARPGVSIEGLFPNIAALRDRSAHLVEEMRCRLVEGCPATHDELCVYEDLALYRLYSQHMSAFDGVVMRSPHLETDGQPVGFWREFSDEFNRLLRLPGRVLPSDHDPAVIFAGFYQIERAFLHIFQGIVGGSMPAARLRAAAWDSIFTRDMRRYTRILHRRMAPVTTLITGPSGTGKELVARAIGLSRHLAFDERTRRFASSRYTPLNLSAFVPTLIESELFGHIKGAFVGALDRRGWLEQCSGPDDTVFLDEIGELDEAIQVKLLRVLQERRFVRVGETTDKPRQFHGKIIAATNRDLAAAIRGGRFRNDFYHRLCDDHIETPSLAEQLADRPQDLPEMVRFLASQFFGELTPGPGPERLPYGDTLALEIDSLTGEVVAWIDGNLKNYPWPGNFRELGQCVRNVMIRGTYHPASALRIRAGGAQAIDQFLEQIREVELTADELLGRYYALACDRAEGSYAAAGRQLKRDWRTVERGLDKAFLNKLQGSKAPEER